MRGLFPANLAFLTQIRISKMIGSSFTINRPVLAAFVPREPWRGYLIAACAVTTALALRLAFDSLWGDRLPYVTFFLAELVVMRCAGTGPLVFTAVTGLLLADWAFVAPRHSFLVNDRVHQINAFLFILLSSLVVVSDWRARRSLALPERAELESRTASANAKTLRGLLPICASCKKIRDDQGYWNQIERYIRDRSDADFTHGICPECACRMYGHVLTSDEIKAASAKF
jgi:K+-sensing histidine kinase KdpD